MPCSAVARLHFSLVVYSTALRQRAWRRQKRDLVSSGVIMLTLQKRAVEPVYLDQF